MGTRSDIIVHRADGKWARIYCHWDGYLEHNGRLLHEHYGSPEQAEALVALGDLSSLGPEIGEKHAFDWRMSPAKGRKGKKLYECPDHPDHRRFERMCTAYGRDRGESDVEADIFDTLEAAWPPPETWTEFTYVFTDGGWWVGDPDEGARSLIDLGDALKGRKTIHPRIKLPFAGITLGRHA